MTRKTVFPVLFLFLIISSFLHAEEGYKDTDPFEPARKRMVENDIKKRGISDPKVLDAMSRVKRDRFVEEKLRKKAYSDHPLPIGEGQTISQPYVVALMTESLHIKKGEKVLEVGTGSGYQAAVLAELTDKVFSIEIRKSLARQAKEVLTKEGYENVRVLFGDGYFGWKEHAPFDAIIITAAANHIPPPLLGQLKDGGRLIIPLGSTNYFQTLTLVEKRGDHFYTRHITGVRFVPMTGEVLKRKP